MSAADAPPLPAALDKPIRFELIETAVKFLQDAQVKSAPLSKRLAFLESKGLTVEEINVAILKAEGGHQGENGAKGSSTTTSASSSPSHSNQSSKIKADNGYKGTLFTAAVILATGSLILSNYQSIKNMASDFISSFINRDREIERVERELKESIEELKRLMEEKERNLQEILVDIKRDRES